MAAKTNPKKRSLETQGKAERAFQAAELYYNKGFTQKEVAKILHLRHGSSVARLLKFAKQIGIVRIEVRPEFAEQPKRNETLELELRGAFGLGNTIVVSKVGYEGEFDAEADERLHRTLGMALAVGLRQMLRSNDHIGVTGGRATYYTARALSISPQPPLKQTGILITSLGGNVSAVTSALKLPIDADDVAYQLSLAFEDATLRRLSLPGVVTSRKVKRELLAKGQGIAISPDLWSKDRVPVPSIATLGLGVLNSRCGHRFLNLEGYELQPIKSELSRLIRLIQRAKYCPVGDIGYRLFYIDPPNKKLSLPKDTIKRLKQLINLLNDRIMCINEEQLRMITRVTVVGGGPIKVNAIWQVLKSTGTTPLVHELCTDEKTAQSLLRRLYSAGKRGFR